MNDSGPGSLRDTISEPNRTVVFEVSGVIEIASGARKDGTLTAYK